MRLQLTVQRHTFPPVKVLYNVGATQTATSAAVGSLTISQFLEQLNELIPLESEYWGLEDYAVEVRGFECLHYTELIQVLKEEDEVCIRPLQTLDLKQRRISGRHQISSDGKHLIDGVAFGRPFPRRIDRPAIAIPPRKRRRMTYNQQDDDDIDELSDERQAVVAPGFYNEDDASADDNDENSDDDYLADDHQQSELAAELQDIHKDRREMAVRDGSKSLDATNGAQDSDSAETSSQRVTRSQRLRGGLGLQGPALLELLDENGRPYPSAYNNPLLDFFSQENPSRAQESSRRKRRKTNGLIDTNDIGAVKSGTSSEALATRDRRESSASIKNVRFQENTLETPPTTILNPDDSEDTDDEDFEPPPDMDNEMNESDKENAEPRVREVSSDIMSSGSDTSSFVSSESDSDSDDSSSSGSSPSRSSSSDMGVDEVSDASSKVQADPDTSSSDLSSSSSSSDADSEDDNGPTSTKESTVSPPTTTLKDTSSKQPNKYQQVEATKSGPKHNAVKQKDLRSIIAATADAALPQPEVSGPPQPTVAPGEGNKGTQKRNERRRLAHILKKGKESGHFADNTTIADIRRMRSAKGVSTEPCDDMKSVNEYASTDNNEFESRRKALLDSIASGGVEVGTLSAKVIEQAAQGSGPILVDDTPDEPAVVQTPSMSEDSATRRPKGSEQKFLQSSKLPLHKEASSLEAPHATSSPVNATQEKSTPIERSADDSSPLVQSSKPRAKVDLASSRRMLFGALGLRTPKTKEDEVALQNKLMKDIKPIKQVLTQPEISHQEKVVEAVIEDDESWRDKIDLRAVECCQEGIVLSTPPFPFVQRWDPQQQRGYNGDKGKKGGRNNKKRKRNSQQCYDDGFEEQGIEPQEKRMNSVSPLTRNTREMEDQQIGVVKPSQAQQDGDMINEQATAGSHIKFPDVTENYEEDLPPLPEDLAGCASLVKDSAIAGTVVAFKKLDMSQETNWQPRVSDYKTAIINEVSEDGTLRMTLAHRDRSNQAISYDLHTGKRMYSKFEMPGYDSQGEEGGEGDSGGLEILFAELIEPKILRISESYQGKENEHKGPESHDDSRTLQINEEDRMVTTNEGNTSSIQGKEIVQAMDTNQDDVAVDIEIGETTIDETVAFDDDVRSIHEVEEENADESWEGIEDTVAEITDKEDTADNAQDTEMEDIPAELAQEDQPDRAEYPDLSATVRTSETAAVAAPTWEPSPSQNDSKRSNFTRPNEQKSNRINEEVREEISKLIRDAGWRSSLNPEVREEEIKSPAKESMMDEIHVRSSEPSSPLNGLKSDLRLDEGDDDQELPAEIAETVQELAVIPDSIEEPRLPSPRREPSLSVDATDEYPTAVDQDSALWDTQANQQIESEGVSSLSSTPKASKRKDASHNSRSRTAKSISPPRLSKSKVSPRISSTAPNPKSKGKGGVSSKKVNGSHHGSVSSSDSEFPSLEKVFARKIASMSHPTSSNFDNLNTNNDDNDISEIKSEASDPDISALPSHPSTQTSNTQKQHTQKRAPPFRSAPLDESSLQYLSEGDTGFVFGSQIPEGSQIIDLTLSSDPVEPSDSAYEGDSSLPNGPGWMQKIRRGERERSAVREGRRGNGGVAMVGR